MPSEDRAIHQPFGSALDERQFIPEIGRVLCVWSDHDGLPTNEDVLSHWANKTASWTRYAPNPRLATRTLQALGLIVIDRMGQCVMAPDLSTAAAPPLQIDPLSEPLGSCVFHRMIEHEPFRTPIHRALERFQVRSGNATVRWGSLPMADRRNPAWIWLQQLGMARIDRDDLILSRLLHPFLLDAGTAHRPVSQAELDSRLAMERERARLAEEHIVELEKSRLVSLGYPEYADGVMRISDDDVTAGYDVLSFDTTGNRRFVEVKSSSGPRSWFVWTQNEMAIAGRHTTMYWLAWIGWASRLPAGACDVAWFQDPAAILAHQHSPWSGMVQDMHVSKISDDSPFITRP